MTKNTYFDFMQSAGCAYRIQNKINLERDYVKFNGEDHPAIISPSKKDQFAKGFVNRSVLGECDDDFIEKRYEAIVGHYPEIADILRQEEYDFKFDVFGMDFTGKYRVSPMISNKLHKIHFASNISQKIDSCKINDVNEFEFLQSNQILYNELEICIIPTAKTSKIVDVDKPVIINYKKSQYDEASSNWVKSHLVGNDTNRFSQICLSQHNRCKYMDICPMVNTNLVVK